MGQYASPDDEAVGGGRVVDLICPHDVMGVDTVAFAALYSTVPRTYPNLVSTAGQKPSLINWESSFSAFNFSFAFIGRADSQVHFVILGGSDPGGVFVIAGTKVSPVSRVRPNR